MVDSESHCPCGYIAADVADYDNHKKTCALEKIIDNVNTQYPVCPWCGYVDKDYFEYHDGNFNCGRCGRMFCLTAEYSVSFCTERFTPASNQGNCGKFKKDKYCEDCEDIKDCNAGDAPRAKAQAERGGASESMNGRE